MMRKGFTLIEILLTIIVIGLLVAVEFPDWKDSENRPVAMPVKVSTADSTIKAPVSTTDRRITTLVGAMDWLKPVQSDRSALCHKVLDSYELIEREIGQDFLIFDQSVDSPKDEDRLLLLTAAKFLRHDCYSHFKNDLVGDGRWLHTYERAALLAWASD